MGLVNYRAGLRRAITPPQLHFSSYLTEAQLPAVPAVFGEWALLPQRTPENQFPLGMLGNDVLGDCTVAGPMHAVILWNAIAGRGVKFTALDAVDDYRDACGYQGTPATDTGGDMVSVAQYWATTGMRDCTAARHKIRAYAALEPSNLDHLYVACSLFEIAGIGVALPPNAEAQFEAGEPWTDAAPNDDDYHFVPWWGRDAQGLGHCGTWGRDQSFTEGWLKANLREAVAYVSDEFLVNNKSPDGVDLTGLMADFQGVTA